MRFLEIKNLQAVPLADIPRLPADELRRQLILELGAGMRLVQFFASEEAEGAVLFAVLADDSNCLLKIATAALEKGSVWKSITAGIPAAHMFEREIFEQCGSEPEGHPWLKPVRKGIAGVDEGERPYEFFAMHGEELHEVGVGPVHAGIIEPGHFRFSCHGETVHHLEIQLGFQHRGVERMFTERAVRPGRLIQSAESIAGDSVIAHAGAFARGVEALAGVVVSRRVKQIRTIALELERIAMHLGDLSALAGDVAYLTGQSVFGALRTKVVNTTMAVCGNRFGRGLMAAGGVYFDITDGLRAEISETVDALEEDAGLASDVMFSAASVMERFERSGVVSDAVAREIGMVGPAARASGVSIDVRADHPFGAYEYFPVHTLTMQTGDVFARAYIRNIEIMQSIAIIREQLGNFPEGGLLCAMPDLKPGRLVVSLAEGWRGEIAHVLITDAAGALKRVKIKDPSFHNWFALALAVRGNGISDFPLCNKSFNLSYCGFDL